MADAPRVQPSSGDLLLLPDLLPAAAKPPLLLPASAGGPEGSLGCRSKASSHDNSLSSSLFEPGSVYDSQDTGCLLFVDGDGCSNQVCKPPPATELVPCLLDHTAPGAAAGPFVLEDAAAVPELLLGGDGDAAAAAAAAAGSLPFCDDLPASLPPLSPPSGGQPAPQQQQQQQQHPLVAAHSLQAAAEAEAAAAAAIATVNAAAGALPSDLQLPPAAVPPLPRQQLAGAATNPGQQQQQQELQVYRLMVLDEESGTPLREATLEDSLQLERSLQGSLGTAKPCSWFRAAGGTSKQQQQLAGEGAGAGEAPVAPRPFSSKCGGPCDHCGVKESPQWRRGPPAKPILCNACGTRFRRTHKLGPLPAAAGPSSAAGGGAKKAGQQQQQQLSGKKRSSSSGGSVVDGGKGPSPGSKAAKVMKLNA